MKRYLVAGGALAALAFSVTPSDAQLLKTLEKDLMGAQGQPQAAAPAQPQVVGSVNLPPGQYMMTNVQTGQAFYVAVQNGQMVLSTPPAPQAVAPAQGLLQQQQQQQQQQPGGFGGLINNGLGNFLKNRLEQQQQAPGQ